MEREKSQISLTDGLNDNIRTGRKGKKYFNGFCTSVPIESDQTFKQFGKGRRMFIR